MKKRILSLALSLALLCSIIPAQAVRYTPYTEDSAICTVPGNSGKASLPHALVRGLGVMDGDENGNMNWDKTLTRVEATTMLVRLMGAEDEAKTLANQATPFSDVPTWANGYVNYAYNHKVVQGVSEGQFGSTRVCTAAEFITMLYRLTDLTEGVDYAWSTAVEDLLRDVSATPFYAKTYQYYQLTQNYGPALKTQPFTRELAASTIFRMMNITAGEKEISLADKLAFEYGLSDTVFYDCQVRRTSWELDKEGRYTTGLGPLENVVFLLKDGKLYMDSPKNVALEFFLGSEAADIHTLSSSQPFTLPKEPCTLNISYYEAETSTYHSLMLNIRWVDEQPMFLLSSHTGVAYDLYYAIQENGFHLRAKTYGVAWSSAGDEAITDEMRTLASTLTAGKSTELAKGKAICNWVSEHIYYDYDEYFDHNASKENIMASRRGVCAGYASLTNLLMRAAGLECYIEESTEHAWNAAFLDGKWVMIDNTWDSYLAYRNGVYMVKDRNAPVQITSDTQLTQTQAVSNMQEPGVTSLGRYFGVTDASFYTHGHTPLRSPEYYLR